MFNNVFLGEGLLTKCKAMQWLILKKKKLLNKYTNKSPKSLETQGK